MFKSYPSQQDHQLFELTIKMAAWTNKDSLRQEYISRWLDMVADGANPSTPFPIFAIIHQAQKGERDIPPLSSLEVALACWQDETLFDLISQSVKNGSDWDDDVVFPGLTTLAMMPKMAEAIRTEKTSDICIWGELRGWQSVMSGKWQKAVGPWEVFLGRSYDEDLEKWSKLLIGTFPQKADWSAQVKAACMEMRNGDQIVIMGAGEAALEHFWLKSSNEESFQRVERFILERSVENQKNIAQASPNKKM